MSWSLKQTMAQAVDKRANWLYNFLLYSEAALDSLSNNFRKKPGNILTVKLYRLLHK